MRVYGLSPEQLDALWVSLRAGESLRSIARHHRVPLQHVRRYFAQTGGVQPRPAGRSDRQLTAAEREEISRGLAAGESFRVIGARLGRSHTTVGREVTRNGGRDAYRCGPADLAAYERGRRPKCSKLATTGVRAVGAFIGYFRGRVLLTDSCSVAIRRGDLPGVPLGVRLGGMHRRSQRRQQCLGA